MGEPAHIHVTGHGGKGKIWLNPIEVAECQGFKANDLKRILEVASENRQLFLEAWDEFFKSIS